MSYRIPSLRTLSAAFGAEKGRALRVALESYREKHPYRVPSLVSADAILDGYGVEGFSVGAVDIEYVNLGESYEKTLLTVDGILRVASWGDIVETLER